MNIAKLSNRVRVVSMIALAAIAPCFSSVAFGINPNAKADAKVTAFLSAGATCDGASSANFAPGGAAVKVSLCITSAQALCGHTTELQAAHTGDSGRFHITAAAHGPNYPDPNGNLTFPVAVSNPPALVDFGATVSSAPVTRAGKQLLVTFDLSPQPNANAAGYVVRLAPASSVSVGAGGACAQPTDEPIAATFKLVHLSGKAARQ